MRAHEFTEGLDEDWRKTAAGLGTAAALGLTSYLGNHQQTAPVTAPAVQQQTAPAPPAKYQELVKWQNTLLKPEAQLLIKTAKQSGIQGEELAQFIAQCGHETANFTSLKEKGTVKFFHRYDPRHNPRIAHLLGNKHAGDGYKYRGRGYIQLTGRDNYRQAEEALKLPLLKHPDLLEDPKVAAQVAVWFWNKRVRPKVGDFSDTRTVTHPINANLRGLEDRAAKFQLTNYLISADKTNNHPKN